MIDLLAPRESVIHQTDVCCCALFPRNVTVLGFEVVRDGLQVWKGLKVVVKGNVNACKKQKTRYPYPYKVAC